MWEGWVLGFTPYARGDWAYRQRALRGIQVYPIRAWRLGIRCLQRVQRVRLPHTRVEIGPAASSTRPK